MTHLRPLLLLSILAAAACDDGTAPEDAARVAIRFQAAPIAQTAPKNAAAATRAATAFSAVTTRGATTATPATAPQPTPVTASQPTATAATNASLTLSGGGHTLVLDDIRLIVSELELEGRADACSSAAGDDEDDGPGCEEFEGGPFLVDLLGTDVDEIVTALVPAGVYEAFEFEVDDLEEDDDEDDEGPRIRSLLSEMRAAYPAFPEEASMVVRGSWDGTPFTVYFEAEIEVERTFDPPFRVPEDGVVTVQLDPAAWFMAGGVPMDLSRFDGQTLEFELDFEDGVEIEHDD